MNKSPLRYPGGKSRACKILTEIVKTHFDIIKFEIILSPFFGGGSFEFHLQNLFNLEIIANDKFYCLYNFWKVCKIDSDRLCSKLYKKIDKIDKDKFLKYRKNIVSYTENNIYNALMYFIINRCSFSGSTLSGGFSQESSKKRFTKSSIDRINKLNLELFTIYNYDYKKFINKFYNEKTLMFLDPPYYLEKHSKLYGVNGDLHDKFNHKRLYNCLSTKKNWILTYNNCEYIKELYKNYKIIETSWTYGMNKSKKSSEIIIINC